MNNISQSLQCSKNHQKSPQVLSISNTGIGEIECIDCITEKCLQKSRVLIQLEELSKTDQILKNWPPLDKDFSQKFDSIKGEIWENQLTEKIKKIIEKSQKIEKALMAEIQQSASVIGEVYNTINCRNELINSINMINEDPSAFKLIVQTKWNEKKANTRKIQDAFDKYDNYQNRINELDTIIQQLSLFDNQQQHNSEIDCGISLLDKTDWGYTNGSIHQSEKVEKEQDEEKKSDEKEAEEKEKKQKEEEDDDKNNETSLIKYKKFESVSEREQRIYHEQLQQINQHKDKIWKLEQDYGKISVSTQCFSWYVEEMVQKYLLEQTNSKLMEITSNKSFKWSSIEEVFSGALKGNNSACFYSGFIFKKSLSNKEKINYLKEQLTNKNKPGWWFWIQLDESNPDFYQYFYDSSLDSFQDSKKNLTRNKLADERLSKAIELARLIIRQAKGRQVLDDKDDESEDDIGMCEIEQQLSSINTIIKKFIN